MSDLIRIAVDAMGGDNSPQKVIDGIIHNHNNDGSNNTLRIVRPDVPETDTQQGN